MSNHFQTVKSSHLFLLIERAILRITRRRGTPQQSNRYGTGGNVHTLLTVSRDPHERSVGRGAESVKQRTICRGGVYLSRDPVASGAHVLALRSHSPHALEDDDSQAHWVA